MKKVFHFADSADTSGYFPQLGKWHDRERFAMTFGTLGPMDPGLRSQMAELDVPTVSLDRHRRAGYPAALPRLAAILRRERVDVFHAHLFDASVVGLLAATIARTPVRVMTRHYSDYHTRIDRPWHVRLDQMCTRLSHDVIAVSGHTAEHMVERENAPPAKLHVVPNGIDFDRVCASDPQAAARVRRELDAADRLVVLTMARLHPEKGHSHLFRALPALKQRLSTGFVVWIAGAGSFESAYRAEVEALGCADVVRFLGFRRDAADLISAADLVVLPSVAEAFGLVLAEAIYLGKPVVATRVGGIPEVVEDGIDGILVPPADSAALADAIGELIVDSSLRQRLAGAGRERIQSTFSFESMMRTYEAVYAARQ